CIMCIYITLNYLFLTVCLCVHVFFFFSVPTVPQQVSLSPNLETQQLTLSWLGGESTTFDIMILRTELNETVFYETVSVTADKISGQHQWNWTSVEPLECTSLSVQIRSRDGQTTSDWSDTHILPGMDLPSNKDSQMFPQDRVVSVGTNTTFCCIVEEGLGFGSIRYRDLVMNVTRLSRRSYAMTQINQGPSGVTGTNVFCSSDEKTLLNGAVVFVGYPPLPSDLVCETHDLVSAVCQWNRGRDTHLYGKKRKTYYTLNGRYFTHTHTHTFMNQKWSACSLAQWDGNFTLVARNLLGQYSLTDSSELSLRVRPVAPANLTSVVRAWNATLLWQWKHRGYDSLALICQVELTSHWHTTTRTFSGVGLRSVIVLDLRPDEDYSIKVRCGVQQNFWNWGDWSGPLAFRTSIDIPDAPDVWMWIERDNTGRLMWKPLTHRESHGQITGYEVTLWSPDENIQHTETLPQSICTVPINLTHISTTGSSSNKVIATVIAKNAAGVSPPASIVMPLRWTDPPAVSRTAYMDGGFPLSWQSDANASCGYVVEWHDASCQQDCAVEWIKVAAENTNISAQSENFQPGVRYTLSLYSCSSEVPQLLQRWEGYMEELVPSSSVPHLSSNQQDSNIKLSWGEIPLVSRRGFLLGYHIYLNNGSQLMLLANVSDPTSRSYTVKGLPVGSYKFTVKAYTSAGEDTGATVSISLESYNNILFSIVARVKKAFYPDIPEPKLAGDWSRTQGPLDVKPSPHSMVHIVEEPEWDSSKEALVVIPEEDEDEDETGDEPVDTDEPTSLRYYNQVIDDRPIRPRFPDSSASSASSLDSARTDVTYTGIQTSGNSLGYRPQMQPGSLSQDMASFGGYQPQCSWHLDSPVEAEESGGLAPSLGSPTSVASTQFLLPDSGSKEQPEGKGQGSSSATTWFHNLLSSAKP
uniref:LIF receptor subunit alpha a n=1 Tax=Myripristis murdjan TaxID=586833 RepID=A0A668A6M6_9TELE